jgi:enterochelin esterase-like enzyme
MSDGAIPSSFTPITTTEAPAEGRRLVGARGMGIIRVLGTFAIVTLVAAGAVTSGTTDSTAATLDVMGFSPDRASLITALILDAIAVAAATFVLLAPRTAIVAGSLVFAAYFERTFAAETRHAMSRSRSLAPFDPAGWALSLLTLVIAAIVVAWMAATLSRAARTFASAAVTDSVATARERRGFGRLRRPAMLGVVVALLAVSVPVFGDMVNYEPDVHMRQGGTGNDVGLTQSAADPVLPSSVPDLPASTVAQGGVLASSTTSRPVLSNARPWLAWQPSGPVSTVQVALPAPWKGGTSSTDQVSVVLPPGYSTNARRYPVLYVVPWNFRAWVTSAEFPSQLTLLTDSGRIPSEIVVFIPDYGAPYPDSECVNSTDGQEWLETFITSTVVRYVDTHFRTIATPDARAILGFSQGGFCAPMLALRHPDVFRTAISFSGYYEAGVRSGQTPNAWRPFGGDASVEAQYSPLRLASTLPPALRASMFFELSAAPNGPFYGPQYVAFARVLHAGGIAVALFPTSLGHSWAAVRAQLPEVLATLGEREAALDVFAG